MQQTETRASTGLLGRDWTKGSILGNLLALSWPMVVTETIYMLTILDMVWVGQLSAAAIAGVGVAFTVVLFVMSAKVGLTVGARALVARYVGAGDAESANHVAAQALLISAVYGAVMMLIGVFLARPIVGLFGVTPDVLAEGATYLRVFSLAWLPISLWLMGYGIIQASGDTRTPMKIEIIFRLLQAVLCPFLVLGWWFFPRLGVAGAAASYLFSEALGVSLGLGALLTGRTQLRLRLRNFRPDFVAIRRIVKIGLPALVMNLQNSLAGLILMALVVPLGTLPVAGHTLVNRIQMIVFMPAYGWSLGAGVLVGQNLGARHPERAERSGWLAAGVGTGFMVASSLALLLLADNVAGIFTSDPGLVLISSTLLRIAAAGLVMMGLSSVLQQSISGAGDTLLPMVVSLAITWIVQLPLVYLLSRVAGLGVNGVRWAIVAGAGISAIVYTVYFRLGRWQRKEV